MNTLEKRLRADAEAILRASIGAVKPDSAVRRALEGARFPGRVFLVAAGKAAWQMASVARETLPALAVAEKYRLRLSPRARALLCQETPKALTNVTTKITGSVRALCAAAEKECRALGYEPVLLTDCLTCEAREAGSFFASVARTHAAATRPLAFLAGGETVVHLRGTGKGGRNQELALSAALGIDGLCNALVASAGSDGTDGPTDAAGGIVDGFTAAEMRRRGVSPERALENNDSYHALRAADALFFTGPTGTNVNDLSLVLLRPEE